MKCVRVILTCLVALGAMFVVVAPARAYPGGGATGTAQINATVFDPGDTVVVTVATTTPGPMTMQILSAPVTIGTGTVGADASGAVSGTVPAGYAGAHTILVTAAGGERYPFAITVRGPASGSTPPATDGGDLATTGVQLGFGVGLGLALLVAGGLVLVAARRRAVPRRLG